MKWTLLFLIDYLSHLSRSLPEFSATLIALDIIVTRPSPTPSRIASICSSVPNLPSFVGTVPHPLLSEILSYSSLPSNLDGLPSGRIYKRFSADCVIGTIEIETFKHKVEFLSSCTLQGHDPQVVLRSQWGLTSITPDLEKKIINVIISLKRLTTVQKIELGRKYVDCFNAIRELPTITVTDYSA